MAKASDKAVAGTANDRAVRRAIRKSDLTSEPPTVGKPVIIDPVEEPKTGRGEEKSDQRSR